MKKRTVVAALAAVGLAALVAVQIAGASSSRNAGPPGPPPPGGPDGGCHLANGVKHVIYIQFDNTHLLRDDPNVPSDLEQMPHLLKPRENNGTMLANDHTALVWHTATGILSSLTGLYPDRQGQTVSNSYDYYPGTTANKPNFTSSFKYWTNPVDADATTRSRT